MRQNGVLLWGAVFCILSGALTFENALAQESESELDVIVGPQVYEVFKGKPAEYSFDLNIPDGDLINPYYIKIEIPISVAQCQGSTLSLLVCGSKNLRNKIFHKREPVSGQVFLNGIEIVGPNDFSAHPKVILEPVELGTNNTITLRLTGKPGTSVEFSILGQPTPNEPPVANFLATLSEATLYGVDFDASLSTDPDNDIVSFDWDFGDGAVGSSESASHVYVAPGDYLVSLTVTDSFGESDSKSLTVNVRDVIPPELVSLFPSGGEEIEGLSVDISGTADEVLSSISVNGSPLSISPDGLSFSGTYAATEFGATELVLNYRDTFNNSGSRSVQIILVEPDTTPPVLTVSPGDQEVVVSSNLTINLSVQSDEPLVSASVNSNSINLANGAVSFDETISFSSEGAKQIVVTATDLAGNSTTETYLIYLTIQDFLANVPPDPRDIATVLSTETANTFYDLTSFLFSSDTPIQVGADPSSIDSRRVTLLQGIVEGESGALPGVKVTVLDRPEFGTTYTGSDGEFSIALNGGERVVLQFNRMDYLPSQRQVLTRWRTSQFIDNVRLLRVSGDSTTVNLSSLTDLFVVKGSTESDGDGDRTPSLFIPPGTSASLELPGGGFVSTDTLTIRITEYTVGDEGPQRMPGSLPIYSGYTYAAEFSADEAISAGAVGVKFNQAIPFYLDNFLGFPVGTVVPSGRYDFRSGNWVGESDGRVIEVAAVFGGVAQVIVGSDGAVADQAILDGMGFTEGELRKIASEFSVGQTVWRTQIRHFSPRDLNFPVLIPEDAASPITENPALAFNEPVCSLKVEGSVIDVERQTLQEIVGISGTDFNLVYSSHMNRGYRANTILSVPLGEDIPASVQNVHLDVFIAGQKFSYDFAPGSQSDFDFVWNTLDAFDRPINGYQEALIRLGYDYQQIYGYDLADSSEFGDSVSWNRVSDADPDASFAIVNARSGVRLSKTTTEYLGVIDSRSSAIGGWTLSAHHRFFPQRAELLRGDGEIVSKRQRSDSEVARVAGTGTNGIPVIGGFAIDTPLTLPRFSAYKSDGTFYIVMQNRVLYVDEQGVVSNFGGGGSSLVDNVLATQSAIGVPLGVATDSEDNIYIAERTISDRRSRVRKIDPNGIITTVAGGGTLVDDNVNALSADLSTITAIETGINDDLFISLDRVIYRLDERGVLRRAAGSRTILNGPSDGERALDIRFFGINDLAIDENGQIYVAQSSNSLIYRITRDGYVFKFAGGGSRAVLGDGGLAVDASLFNPRSLDFGVDGSMYIADFGNYRIRKISPNGIITTVVGTSDPQFNPDLVVQAEQFTGTPTTLDAGPNGNVLFTSITSNTVHELRFPYPELQNEQFVIASSSGDEVYVFTPEGRHLETRNSKTGQITYLFRYNSDGQLVEVEDADSRVTAIERDGSGFPTSIVSPFGVRTNLATNADGFLTEIKSPKNESVNMTYHGQEGLLASFTNARGFTSTFEYDNLGRLTRDIDVLGGFTDLAVTRDSFGYQVETVSAESRRSNHFVNENQSGPRVREYVDRSGYSQVTTSYSNGMTVNEYPDNTVIETVRSSDPRFGSQSTYVSSSVAKLPSGLTSVTEVSREIIQSDLSSYFSLEVQTDTIDFNGKIFTDTYDVASNSRTQVSAVGRVTNQVYDARSRLVQSQVDGIFPVDLNYDSEGFLTSISQDNRATAFSYNSDGYISSITNAENQTTEFETDANGRVTKQILPDNREIEFAYDSNGNLAAIAPPGRPFHEFYYTDVDLLDTYVPAPLAFPTSTVYSYNLDRDLTQISRPDGKNILFDYDSGGRLSLLTSPSENRQFNYYPITGRLSSIVSSSGNSTSFGYDGFLITDIAWGGDIQGEYNRDYSVDFQLSAEYVNAANPILFNYDDDGLLIQAGAQIYIRNNLNGLLQSTELDSVSESMSYNGFGELAAYSSNAGYSYSFTRDRLGRILTKAETVLGVTTDYEYTYDSSGRLTNVRVNNSVNRTYGYDLNSNRLAAPNLAGVATYDDQDRLVSYGTISFSYNANGDLVSKTNSVTSQTTNYAYDVYGNLISVSLPSGNQLEYEVDPMNRRVGKRVNGSLVQGFLYKDQLNPIAQLDGSGNVVARFVYGSKSNVPDYMIKNGTVYKIISDHLGSVRLVVDASDNSVAQRMDYDEFGVVTNDTNPGFQPFGFAGGIYDGDTGLTRFGARDYDAVVGRWTNKDSVRFVAGDTNLYGYVLGDPVNFFDPTGKIISDRTGGKIPPEVKNSRLYKELDRRPELITISINNSLDAAGQASYFSDGSQTIEINPNNQVSQNDLIDTYIHELNHASLNITFNGQTSEFFDTELVLPQEIQRNFGVGGIGAGQCR